MPGLDPFQKRSLEHDLRAAGLSRSQAKLAVSRVHQALLTGQLRVGGGVLPAVLGWLGLGQRHQAKPQAKGKLGHEGKRAAACAAACQCATSASQSHSASQGRPASEAQHG